MSESGPTHAVPPEVARKVVRILNDRRMLALLARVCHSFQAVAERYLYSEVIMGPYHDKLPLLRTLARVPRVAQLVRVFRVTSRVSRMRTSEVLQDVFQTAAQSEFWTTLREAIFNLGLLEYFEIEDTVQLRHLELSILISPPPPRLQASEIKLDFPWDANVSEFLATQTLLRKLHMPDVVADVPLVMLPQDALPRLTLFEGPAFVLDQLYHCPVTRLKFNAATEEAISLLPLVLPELYKFRFLYSLSIILLPYEASISAVEVISNACPNLTYLSIIPYPCRYDEQRLIIQCLARLKRLRAVELDVETWNPPLVGVFQRAVATEFRTFIPTMTMIRFWSHDEYTWWAWSPEHTEPIHAVLLSQATGKAKNRASDVGVEAFEENVLDIDIGGRAAHAGEEESQEELVMTYTGPDGWLTYPRRHGSGVAWWKVAATDDFWSSSSALAR